MAYRPTKRGSSTNRSDRNDVFRTTQNGFVPSSVGLFSQLTVDAAMKSALTQAGVKLVIEIDAGGTRVILSDRNGQTVGGPEDLDKLGSIKTFVSRERKEALKKDTAKDVSQVSYLITEKIKENNPDFKMSPVDAQFQAKIRPLQQILNTVRQNRLKVENNTSHFQRNLYEPVLMRMFTGISNACVDQLAEYHRFTEAKSTFKGFLSHRGVPYWVYTRLSSPLQLERTENLEKVFFPSDPSKGLTLSLREWRNEDVIKNMTPLMDCSHFPYFIVNDDDVLVAYLGLEMDPDLSPEPEQFERVLDCKMHVIPLAFSADRVIELGSKKARPFSFSHTSMDSFQGALTCLSNALLRVFTASLQTTDLAQSYYSVIAPGAIANHELKPGKNYYALWGQAGDQKSTVWLEAIKGGPNNMHVRESFWTWVSTELRLVKESRAYERIAEKLRLNRHGITIPPHIVDRVSGDILIDDYRKLKISAPPSLQPREMMNPQRDVSLEVVRPLSAVEYPIWYEYQTEVFPRGSGKTNKGNHHQMSLSALTSQGKELIARVEEVAPSVSERMQAWLRSFSDERLQIAAVRVTNAEFDTLFTSYEEEEKIRFEDESDEGA